MPFLTQKEFPTYLGQLANSMTGIVGAFDEAEKSAANHITEITGLAAPADAKDAPPWAKQASAWIIGSALIGTITTIRPEQLSWAEKRRADAEVILQEHQTATPTGGVGPQTFPICGVVEW
ncbi:MAG: hypothetical protein ABI876_03495 [Bacteroidota bacterium]